MIRLRFIAQRTVLTLILLYAVVCLLMWAGQRSLLYFPPHRASAPEASGLNDFTEAVLQDEDGTHIHAWQHKANPGYPTVLFFHGNGDDMSGPASFYKAMGDAGFGVLAIDYRGFGASEGKPSEQGLYEDARAAIAYAEHTLGLAYDRMILYGESLGTGVAVQMATEFPVSAIVLQSPYTSIADAGQARYPWVPVSLLLEDRFDSLSKMQNVHAKLLLIHGERDRTVPVEEGKRLFAAAGEPKEAVYYPKRGHVDLSIAERLGPLMVFAQKYGLITTAR